VRDVGGGGGVGFSRDLRSVEKGVGMEERNGEVVAVKKSLCVWEKREVSQLSRMLVEERVNLRVWRDLFG
jgi:uncharacterized protein YxjI